MVCCHLINNDISKLSPLGMFTAAPDRGQGSGNCLGLQQFPFLFEGGLPMFDNIQIDKLFEIGIHLTSEKNYNQLLSSILDYAMQISNCDAGTLYLLDNESQSLQFKIMKTRSLSIDTGSQGEKIDLPNVPLSEKNVCAYSAIKKSIVNIDNVYDNVRFDFSGPKSYDRLTGYHTRSMLVVPLENHEGELLGVFQLINAMDPDGNIVAFVKEQELFLLYLASISAISLSNMLHIQEVKELLYSLVASFTAAVDARTPYNANHTKNVTAYVNVFINYLNKLADAGRYKTHFSKNDIDQLQLASLLHDIGKLIIPLNIMNKPTRLGDKLSMLNMRFDLLLQSWHIDYLEGTISNKIWQREREYILLAKEKVETFNSKGFLTEEELEFIHELSNKYYTRPDGTILFYLTPEEKECLSVQKGTLTEQERIVMESHVDYTRHLLSKIRFHKNYDHVAFLAGSHHEYLDGSGYPDHLSGDALPVESRILTICDIFDALTAKDRPYKKALPVDKSLSILESMASEGKLDAGLVAHFRNMIEEQAEK